MLLIWMSLQILLLGEGLRWVVIFLYFGTVNTLPHNLILMTLKQRAFESIVGKGENAFSHNIFYTIKDRNHQ